MICCFAGAMKQQWAYHATDSPSCPGWQTNELSCTYYPSFLCRRERRPRRLRGLAAKSRNRRPTRTRHQQRRWQRRPRPPRRRRLPRRRLAARRRPRCASRATLRPSAPAASRCASTDQGLERGVYQITESSFGFYSATRDTTLPTPHSAGSLWLILIFVILIDHIQDAAMQPNMHIVSFPDRTV